jgi:hypothetical protein
MKYNANGPSNTNPKRKKSWYIAKKMQITPIISAAK